MVNFLIFQSTGSNRVDTNIETIIIKRYCQNEGGKKMGNTERRWVRDLRKTLGLVRSRLAQNFLHLTILKHILTVKLGLRDLLTEKTLEEMDHLLNSQKSVHHLERNHLPIRGL